MEFALIVLLSAVAFVIFYSEYVVGYTKAVKDYRRNKYILKHTNI